MFRRCCGRSLAALESRTADDNANNKCYRTHGISGKIIVVDGVCALCRT